MTGVVKQGSIAADASAVGVDTLNAGSLAVQVTGTFTLTLAFQGTIDGTNWFAVNALPVVGGAVVTGATATGQWVIGVAGLAQFRVLSTAYTSGTAVINICASVGSQVAAATASAGGGASSSQVQGAAAHDAATSGNPLLNGLEARRARPTAVSADGDAVKEIGDRYGRAYVVGVDLSVAAIQATASGDTSLIAAPGSGNRLKILRVEASNSHATVAVTAGLKTASLFAGATFGKKYLPAIGGAGVWVFPGGHLLCGDNEALSVNLSAGSTTIEVTAYYEVIAS